MPQRAVGNTADGSSGCTSRYTHNPDSAREVEAMRLPMVCGWIGLFVATAAAWPPRPAAAQWGAGQAAAAKRTDETEENAAAPDFAALLDKATPNSTDSELIRALREGDLDRAVALLAEGADVNAPGELGRTALMYASAAGREDLAAALLDAGAEIHAKDDSGNTALFFLPSADDPAVVELLLARGARVAETNRVGHMPLRNAAFLGHTAILDMPFEGGDQERGALGLLGAEIVDADPVRQQQLHHGLVAPAGR